MATATLTTTPSKRMETNYKFRDHDSRGLQIESGLLTFDGGTYATGGIAWTPTAISLANLLWINFETDTADQGGRLWRYDYTNGKIQIFEAGTASASFNELGNGSDTLSETIRYLAVGY